MHNNSTIGVDNTLGVVHTEVHNSVTIAWLSYIWAIAFNMAKRMVNVMLQI